MRRHILFDFDGTLMDTGQGIMASARHALKTMGRPIPAKGALRRFVGPPLNESFHEVCGLSDGEIQTAISAFRAYYAEEGIRQTKPYPGMGPLLEGLVQSGRVLHVATTKPTPLARQMMDAHGLSPYFTVLSGSPPGGSGLPKAQVVRRVLSAAAAAAEDAVMVGDTHYDVRGAHENGLPCVGVLFGYGTREELTAAGADFMAADVPALKRILYGPL